MVITIVLRSISGRSTTIKIEGTVTVISDCTLDFIKICVDMGAVSINTH